MFAHKGPVSRILVIGDIHGDLSKAMACAAIAGVALPDGSWRKDVPPNTVVVQVGDQLDGAPRLSSSRRPSGRRSARGGVPEHDCEKAVIGDLQVLQFFDELDRQAKAAGRGCRVYSLLGNHEMNNADGNIDYADVCKHCRGTRQEFFKRGSSLAGHLASTRHVCMTVAGVLFAHAGVCPRHLRSLDVADRAAAAFLRGTATQEQMRIMDDDVTGPEGMLCHRDYAPDEKRRKVTTKHVEEVLKATGCNAMVLGHNAHSTDGGITSLHENRVWVVDPGMSSSIFGAPAAVLQINFGKSGQYGDMTIRTLRAAK